MVANRPWDGSYNVSDTIWVIGHTTQFTERGWFYLGGGACALLAGGGSYVSLASPGGDDVTIVIETVGASTAQDLTIDLKGSLASVKKLFVWTTAEGAVFEQQAAVLVGSDGTVTVKVPANNVWTLSTTTGQQKGGASIPARPLAPLALPYFDGFGSYPEDTLAKYYSDMHGAFAVFTDPTGNGNKVLRQQADTIVPLATHGRGATAYAAIFGDPDWSGYSLETMVRSEGGGSSNNNNNNNNNTDGSVPAGADEFVFVGITAGDTAASSMGSLHPEVFYHAPYSPKDGVVLVLAMSGSWSLTVAGDTVTNGTAGRWSSGHWLTVELATAGSGTVSATVNGVALARDVVVPGGPGHGPAWIGCGIHHCSWDNVTVTH